MSKPLLAILFLTILVRANPVPVVTWRAPDAVDTTFLYSNAADTQLTTYHSNEMSEFAVDSQLSAAWSTMTYADSLRLEPPGQCYPGKCQFDGPADASVTARALADDLGLYMLAKITDDSWAVPMDSQGTGGDMLLFYFDKVQSETLFQDILFGCIIGDCHFQCRYNSLVVAVCPTAPPDLPRIALHYYDDNMWSWQVRFYTQDEISAFNYIKVDFITLSDTRRAIELFIPWISYCKGLPIGTTMGGPMAFSVGYDDRDGADTAVSSLRWLNKDPYSNYFDECYWGDLYFNPLSAPTSPVSTIPSQTVQARQAANTQWRAYDLLGRIETRYHSGIRLVKPNTPRSAPVLQIQLP